MSEVIKRYDPHEEYGVLERIDGGFVRVSDLLSGHVLEHEGVEWKLVPKELPTHAKQLLMEGGPPVHTDELQVLLDAADEALDAWNDDENDDAHHDALKELWEAAAEKYQSFLLLHAPTLITAARQLEEVRRDAERLQDAMQELRQWVEAYPVDVFLPPDLKKAHEVLAQNGMTLDGIAAHVSRHVLTGVKRIVDAQLGDSNG